ncbi:hypothetical protein SAMN04487944_11652 [Gracilibacillus ureilyticus]|uniref:Uncharacterized protein n=1 Tax=Gracilibacillus ureilyticus TaxID=531814 RepID=A0A1H9U6Y7_9BACI|nr:hypothetical protein [Gracilibacillus ureilyticus]SES05082.1 hypothetical protein SAMN04487944_11652 [Gracilibacillus ureilyticus]
MDNEQAMKAMNNASGVAFFQAGFMAIVITVLLWLDKDLLGLSAYSYIDAAIFGCLAVGVKMRSRVAGVMLVIYFIIAQIVTISMAGAAGIFVAILFGYIYIKGMRASFSYHKNPETTKEKEYSVIGMISFAIAMIQLFLAIIFVMLIGDYTVATDIAFVVLLLSLLGFGLGIGGIFQKRMYKKFTIWGLAINGVFFILPNIAFVVM